MCSCTERRDDLSSLVLVRLLRVLIEQDGPDAKPLGRGTRIELVLKEDMAEFLEERKVNRQY